MKRSFLIRATAIFFMIFFAGISLPVFGESISSVWKISRDGRSLFLGGSIHILRAKDFPLPEQFEQAFAQSSMLVLETDIEQMADETLARHLLIKMLLSGGQTLDTVLDTETYALLAKKCDEYGIPTDFFSGFKPAMIVSMLTMLEMRQHGFLESGVDLYFLEKAKLAEMPRGFLETVESQIEIIVTMGDGYENDFVKYSLADMDDTEAELDSMVSAWRSGNSEYNETILTEMKETWPVLYKRLFTDRNAAWLPLLQNYLATDTVEFVIVGLAHLHGEDGLIGQLANSGYTVEQLR